MQCAVWSNANLQVDKFVLDLYALGMLTKVRIGYRGKEKFSWYLEKVAVKCLLDSAEAVFPCAQWLKSGDDPVRELVASRDNNSRSQIALKQKIYRYSIVSSLH